MYESTKDTNKIIGGKQQLFDNLNGNKKYWIIYRKDKTRDCRIRDQDTGHHLERSKGYQVPIIKQCKKNNMWVLS